MISPLSESTHVCLHQKHECILAPVPSRSFSAAVDQAVISPLNKHYGCPDTILRIQTRFLDSRDWKRGSMMRHADPLLSALVLGRQKWRALIGLEKILVVIVTANREHALSWDVMNSAVPLPCGGYLLRNVFLEDSLCVVMMMMLRGSSLWKRQWTIH